MKLPWAKGSYYREAAQLPAIPFKNRMVEPSPVLTDSPAAAISRPAMRRFAVVGDGPVRSLFSAPGLFDEQLFVVSGGSLYTVDTYGTSALVGLISTASLSDVSWAAVANIGAIPSRLFFSEGSVLWVYTANGEAQGQLAFSANAANSDVVRIDSIYYQFTTGSVDAGTPAGTVGNPWLVAVGASLAVSVQNLYDAINDSGVAGTAYSTVLTAHPTVRGSRSTATDLYVVAQDYGTGGNAIVTTETGANMAWGGGTLSGGGDVQLRQVQMPDDVGAISVAHINGYVIVVPVQSEELGTTGQFYWIDPGETFVAPENWATAERAPDEIQQVRVFGNMFWLLGSVTTEPWITTGDPDAPMQRFQSIVFDRGSWEGTAVQVKDSLIVVDEDGGVFQIAGGQERISRPDIEARIRKAIQQST